MIQVDVMPDGVVSSAVEVEELVTDEVLIDEVITNDVITSDMITIDVLLDGGSSQIIALPSKYRFGSEAARDAYFAAYPAELTPRLWVLVNDVLYQYLGNAWICMLSAITGPAGASFKVVGLVDTVDDLPSPLYAATNESYLVADFEDGNHLFILVDNEWVDQGMFSGVPGPQGPTGNTGPKGDTGEVPRFKINDDGHLIAVYKGDVPVEQRRA